MRQRFNSPCAWLVGLIMIAFAFCSVASGRLGMTVEEWKERFGPPNGDGHYLFEYGGAQGPFLLAARIKDGVVQSIELRKVSGTPISNGLRRELVGQLQREGDYRNTEFELSEDGRTLTIRPVAVKANPLPSKPVLGLTSSEVRERFGKGDGSGVYRLNEYQIKPQTEKGTVVWIKAWKTSGESLSEEEVREMFSTLTGLPEESMKSRSLVHDGGKSLIVTSPD